VNKDRWLVTGGQGFLGANAGRFLTTRDTEAIALIRKGNAPFFPATIRADLFEVEQVRRVVNELKPDVILHCAALSSHPACEEDPILAERVNAQATGEIASAAQECGARLIYISTDSVFSGERGNYSEGDATDPFSVYGETKWHGEQLARENADPLIIRTNFFGWSPSHQRSILEFFYNNLKAGKSVPGYTNVTTTSLYVQTLLEYIWELDLARRTGIFHVTSQNALTKNDFGRHVSQVFDFDESLIHDTVAKQPRDISLSTEKLTQALGHRPDTQLNGLLTSQLDLKRT